MISSASGKFHCQSSVSKAFADLDNSGKISDIKVQSSSSEASSTKSATVVFEKETAAKTALLLDQTQLGASQVSVKSSTSSGQSSTGKSGVGEDDDHEVTQDDKPRSRIIAEYLAHGYVKPRYISTIELANNALDT